MSNVLLLKEYRYKVYDPTGTTYLGELNNITNDPNITWEMNSAGGQLVLEYAKPADNFGEGSLIKFRNMVKVYCIDGDTPTGTPIFIGFISNWTPKFVPGQEMVEITLLSYGFELSQIVLQNNQANPQTNQLTQLVFGGSPISIAQLITLGPSTQTLTGVDIFLDNPGGGSVEIDIYAFNPASPNTPSAGSLLATVNAVIDAPVPAIYHWDFSGAPATVMPSSQVWLVVHNIGGSATNNIGTNSTNTYPGGKMATYNGSSWTILTAQAMYFVLYPNLYQTDCTFGENSPVEIGTMLLAALTNYMAQGGTLAFDSSSITTATGITVQNLQISSMTVFDFLNQCCDLVPNSYWYVDQTANKIYFQTKATAPAYKFTLGKDLQTIQLQKYMESIVNTLLLTGGGSPSLFRQYIKQDSVALYGTRTGTYSDSNITTANQAIADQIGRAYVINNGYPQVRATISVIDTAAGGFDIETLRPGAMCAIRGTKGNASSLWDVGKWDFDYWDFNIYDMNSMLLQISKISYTPGVATLDIAMVPPTITKEAKVLSTAITQQQQIDNPSTPVTVLV